MPAQQTACPADDTLRAFGLGRLDGVLAQAIAKHFDGCRRCLEIAGSVDPDSFVGRM